MAYRITYYVHIHDHITRYTNTVQSLDHAKDVAYDRWQKYHAWGPVTIWYGHGWKPIMDDAEIALLDLSALTD